MRCRCSWLANNRCGRWSTATAGREINELHVPLGQPVRLWMTSQDVIHSFYVPAFRLKQDAVPGRYTALAFTVPGATSCSAPNTAAQNMRAWAGASWPCRKRSLPTGWRRGRARVPGWPNAGASCSPAMAATAATEPAPPCVRRRWLACRAAP
ncbi:MAG: hypothetical protein V4724_36755 [Pseudomonadota bacterium]